MRRITGWSLIWIAVAAVIIIVGYMTFPRDQDTIPDTKPDNKPVDDTVTDIDGNIYKTIKIGNQTWMAENLRTIRLNDGQPISYKPTASDWAWTTSPAYCWANNSTLNKVNYGALYNWYTVNTGKLAPVGWHIPTDKEWKALSNYLGGDKVAGGKLKELGFTVRWAGLRQSDGKFDFFGEMEKYWSATEGGWHSGDAWYRTITKLNSEFGLSSHQKFDGHCVRCIKDK